MTHHLRTMLVSKPHVVQAVRTGNATRPHVTLLAVSRPAVARPAVAAAAANLRCTQRRASAAPMRRAAGVVVSSMADATEPAMRDDDILPNDLFDAVSQAGQATAAAIKAGSGRCVAELLIPELWDVSSGPVMAEEGDQMRWWELAREFIMQTSQAHGGQVRAVFPDAGGAAMLKNRWGANATFEISSLDDKNPMTDEDTLVIITCPDPPSLKAVQRLADTAVEKGCPLVMFNPRLASGDVGIGVAVRDMRLNFLSTFNYVYSLAPIPYANASVFRKYPGQWQVFMEDEANPGRFNLIAEQATRPVGESLEDILMRPSLADDADEDGVPREKTLMEKAAALSRDMQRFMKALK